MNHDKALVRTNRIFLHGRLRKKFGGPFDLGVHTPAQAFHALSVLIPGFRQEIAKGQYRIVRGKKEGGVDLSVLMLYLKLGLGNELHVIPIARGGKNSGGAIKMVVGAVIAVVAIVASDGAATPAVAEGGTAAGGAAAGAGAGAAAATGLAATAGLGLTYGQIALAGGLIFFSGITAALSPQPKKPNPNAYAGSYLIGGQLNTVVEGVPVPLTYGHIRVGSVQISVGYTATDYTAPVTADASNNTTSGASGNYDTSSTFSSDADGGLGGGAHGAKGRVKFPWNRANRIDSGRSPPRHGSAFGLGAGGGGGGKSGSATSPTDAPNTLRSDAILRIIDLISEGPIGGLVNGPKSIFFNNVPLMASDGTYNFLGVTWQIVYGNPDQAPVSGYPAAEETVPLGGGAGIHVLYGTPIVQTIISSTATSLNVTVQIPALYQIDQSSGNIYAAPPLDYVFDVQPYGSDTWTTVVSESLVGQKTESPYQRTYRFDLPASTSGSWNVRLTRATPDSDDTTLENDIYWFSYDIITDYQLIYPNCAMCYLTIDAEAFGSSLPSRQYEIYGIEVQVPANYNPTTRVYATSGVGTTGGAWDGVTMVPAVTDDPCWCTLDLLTNARYGLGLSDAQVAETKFDLYAISQYCAASVPDGFGGTEPRYTFNCCIANQDDAYKILQSMVASFRGMMHWGAGRPVITADMPLLPAKVVHQANVLNGMFDYEGTNLSSRHRIARVSYLDANNYFTPATEVVENPTYLATMSGQQPADIVAFGCTSRGLAHRLGRWFLDTEQTSTETVSYKTGMSQLDVRPGEIIVLTDPSYAGIRMGGRIRTGSTTSLVYLDALFTPNTSQSYRLSVMMPDGTVSTVTETGTGQITSCAVASFSTSADGTYTIVHLAETLPLTPQPGAEWLLTGSGLAPRQFTVMGVQEPSRGTFAVTGIYYDPTKFERIEDNINLPTPIFSAIGTLLATPMPVVSNVQASSFFITVGGSALIRTLVSFTPPPADPRLIGYQVQALCTTGELTQGTTTGSPATMDGLQAGNYIFSVRTVGNNNQTGAWVNSANTVINGTSQGPTAVTNLQANGGTRLINVAWTASVSSFTAYYEVWRKIGATPSYGNNNDPIDAGATHIGNTATTAYLDNDPTNLQPNTTAWYWVRGIAASGVQGGAGVAGAFCDAASGTTTLLVTDDLAEGIITTAQFAQGINVPSLVTSLPSSGTVGQIVTLESTVNGESVGTLYQWNGTAWVPVVASIQLADVLAQPTLTNTQITNLTAAASAGTLTTAQLQQIAGATITGQLTPAQAAAIAAAQLTGQLTSAQIGSIPASEITGQLTASQIASLAATQITGQLTSSQIAGLTAAASTLTGQLTASQIASVNASSITGTLTASQIASLTAAQITGTLTASQIASIAATQITGTISAGQIANIPATQITGTLTASQIASIAASQISGQLTSSQIASLAAADIIGTISAGQIANIAATQITGTLTASQIASLAASQITGTLTSSQIASIAAANIIGTIGAGQIGTIAATQITGQLTASQIASLTASQVTGTLTASQIAGVNAAALIGTISAGQIASIPATQISGTLTASQIASLAATQITGTLSSSQIASVNAAALIGTISAGQIASIPATQISGTLTASQIASLAATQITGQLTASQIASIAAGQITGTLTASQIASLTAAQLTGQITATQIANGAISTPQLAAGAVTTANLAAGSVTANQLAVGSGANVVWNPCFANDASGWTTATSGALTPALAVAASTWTLPTFGTGALSAAGTLASGAWLQMAWAPQSGTLGVPCNPGDTWEIQARVIPKNCAVQGLITFYNAAGTSVGSVSTNAVTASTQTSGTALADYTLIWGAGVVPVGAVTALGILQVNGTGASNPALYVTQVGIGPTYANATAASTWTPGGVTSISGGVIQTGTITARSIAAATITATQIAASTITGTNIAAGTITAGNLSAGSVTAASILAGTITATQLAANTITAGQIAANTITSGQIAANTITASNIAAGAITATQLSAGSVTASALSANSVTAAAILAGTITATQIAAGTITAGNLAAGSVTAASIAAGTITGTQIAAQTIQAANIAANVITAQQIAANTITASQIAASTITATNLAAGSVTASALAANSVTAASILAGTITATQIASQTITAANLAAGSVTAASILAGTITATQIATGTITASNIAANTITATQLAANTITASQIAASAITATQLSAGSVTASALAANSVTAASILAGTITATQIAANTITAGKLAAGSVTAASIAAGTITATQLAANTITAGQIAANTITSGQIAANTITASNIAAGAITATQLAAGSVTASALSANAVTAASILAGTITSTQIAAGTITAANLAAGSITTAALAVGSGANVVWNSCFINDASGWIVDSNQLSPTLAPASAPWSLVGFGTGVLSATGTLAAGNYIDAVWQPQAGVTGVPANPGDTWDVQARVIAQNCYVTAYIFFYNAAGGFIGDVASTTNAVAGSVTSGAALSDYTLIWGSGAAPAGTQYAHMQLRIWGTGAANPTAYITQVATGVTYPNATGPAPWSPGGVTSISGGVIETGTITARNIAANTITAQQIAANTITASQIAAGAITATQLAAGSVTASALAAGSVTAASILAGTITSSQIAASTITAANLAAGSVTTAALAVGSGSNQIWNSCFALTSDGWNASWTSAGWTWGSVIGNGFSSNFALGGATGDGSGYASFSGTLTSGNEIDIYWAPDNTLGIPVVPGNAYEFQAQAIVGNGAQIIFYGWFFDQNGNILTTPYYDVPTMPYPSTAQTLSAYGSYDRIVVAPANAAYFRATIRVTCQGSSASNPFAVFTHLLLGQVPVNATQAQPWTPGGVTQISGGIIKTNSVQARSIAAGTITAAQIAASTITGTNIAAGTITAGNLSAGSVTAASILAGTITGTQIAGQTITASNIAAGTITAAQINAGTLTAATLAVGFGSNVIWNSCCAITTDGWAAYPSGGASNLTFAAVLGSSYAPNYLLAGDNSGYIQADLTAGAYVDVYWLGANGTGVPVVAGQTWEFQVAGLATNGAKFAVYAWGFQANGSQALIFFDQSWGMPGSTSGTNLSNYGLYYRFFTIPAGVVRIQVVLRLVQFQGVAQTGVAAVFTHTLLGQVPANAIQPQIWVPGGITAISGGVLTTDSITARNIAANAITATQIAAGSITTGALAAGAVTASTIAAGAITSTIIGAGTILAANLAAGAVTTSALAVAYPSNVVWNTNCDLTTAGWSFFGASSGVGVTPGYGPVRGSAFAASYLLAGEGCCYVYGNLNTSSDYILACYDPDAPDSNGLYGVACTPNGWMEAQALFISIGCQAYVRIDWYDGNGAFISAAYGTSVINPQSNGVGLWEYRQSFVIAQAPGTAVRARLSLIGQDNVGGISATTPAYIFFARTAIGISSANATQPQPWAPGGVTSINGGVIQTGTVYAQQLAAGSVTANAIAAGSITAGALAANSVTAAVIAAGAIGASQIAAGAIEASALASSTLITSAAQMGSDVIGTAQIQNLAVTTLTVAGQAITAGQLGYGSVTNSAWAASNGGYEPGTTIWETLLYFTITVPDAESVVLVMFTAILSYFASNSTTPSGDDGGGASGSGSL